MGIICTDAGHGGTDSGAVWKNVREKDLNLTYTMDLNEELKKRGHQVFTTRTSDFTFPLGERCNLVNTHHRAQQPRFDAIVSIHNNVAARQDPATGEYKALANIEGFYAIYSEESPKSTKLASKIAATVSSAGITQKHGGMLSTIDLGRTLAWIHKTTPPATLLELGFMTNPGELDRLQDASYRRKMVLAIADGIESFLN